MNITYCFIFAYYDVILYNYSERRKISSKLIVYKCKQKSGKLSIFFIFILNFNTLNKN